MATHDMHAVALWISHVTIGKIWPFNQLYPMNLSFVEEKMGAFRRIGPMRNGDGSVLDLTGGS